MAEGFQKGVGEPLVFGRAAKQRHHAIDFGHSMAVDAPVHFHVWQRAATGKERPRVVRYRIRRTNNVELDMRKTLGDIKQPFESLERYDAPDPCNPYGSLRRQAPLHELRVVRSNARHWNHQRFNAKSVAQHALLLL